MFILITPPFEAPDEPVHFFRSYQVSTLNLSVDRIGNTYGGILPYSLQKTVALTWDSPALAFHPNIKYPLGYTKQALSIKTTNEKHIYDFSTTAPYSPISYIPQAIGVGIARLLKMPPVIMMYIGRLFNLVAWISLFYLAIRLMPRKRWALVFIGLIPMALFQAASLSSDVMAIGLLAVFLAWLFLLMESKEKLSTKTISILTGLLILLALSKQIMFLFVPLVLLLPRRLFKNKKTEYLLKAVFIILPIILFGLWMLHIKGIPLSTSVGPINPPEQIKHLIVHPLHGIKVLTNTYFFTWGDGIYRSFIGNFGWVDAPLSEGIVTLGYLAFFILLVANTERAKVWLNRRQKLFILALAAVYIAAVSAALYAYFTPVGFNIVVGLVGRYYYPFALLLIPLLYGDWLRINRVAYRRIAVWAPLFLLTCSLITIFVRYYVNNV
jgi:uncharacterized membrane protein